MAERTILVCDVCGEPAAKTVTLKIGNRSLLKDLCERAAKSAKRGATAGRTRRPSRHPIAAEAAYA
jgi:hypothetical protein